VQRFDDLPLFVLGIVLLPQEVLSLHVFEQRYRDLVERCLETGEPFCVVHSEDGDVAEVGCLAGSIEVVRRFDDGRLNIVVTGQAPVRLDEIDESRHSYLSADAHVLDDEDDAASDESVSSALAAFKRLVEVAEGNEGPPAPDPGPQLSYGIASRIEFGPAIKQALLEARSERARLADVTALVTRATRTVETQRTIARRARTNGRVAPAGDGEPGPG
jgi:Lon protease-like protein